MNRKLILTALIICTLSVSMNSFLQREALNEDSARKIAQKFKPILMFSEEEQYWPAAIEWFEINWASAPLGNENATVSYNYTGPEDFDETAPVYVSLFENSDGTLRISYAFLYAFNGCGPKLSAKFRTNFGFNLNQEFSICPLGLHWGDIERITVHVAKDYTTVTGIDFAYHDDYIQVSPSEIKFRRNRPLVYVAPGSHASYHSMGEKEIMPLWNFTKYTFNSIGHVVDNISSGHEGETWMDYPIRLLKFNGQPTTDISKEESYLAFLFTGRLGNPITNANFDMFQQEVMAYANAIKPISVEAYYYAVGAINYLTQNVHKNACPTLAGPGRESWW